MIYRTPRLWNEPQTERRPFFSSSSMSTPRPVAFSQDPVPEEGQELLERMMPPQDEAFGIHAAFMDLQILE